MHRNGRSGFRRGFKLPVPELFLKGDKPDTITLEAGTFVELYNMQMKPTGLA